jgi:hypothetical protein
VKDNLELISHHELNSSGIGVRPLAAGCSPSIRDKSSYGPGEESVGKV